MTKSPDEYESAQCGGPYCRPWRPALSRKYASAVASAAGSAGGLRWLCKRPVLAGVPTYWHLYPPPCRPQNGRLPYKRKHAIIARFLFAARFARYARYLKQKLFRGTPPPGRTGGFRNSPSFPSKTIAWTLCVSRRFLCVSAFCRAHTARHGAYTVFEGKAGYLCRTRRGGKFFRAKTGCQSCPVQRAPPNTDRSLLRGRAALAAIKHSAASYRPRGRPP